MSTIMFRIKNGLDLKFYQLSKSADSHNDVRRKREIFIKQNSPLKKGKLTKRSFSVILEPLIKLFQRS